MLPQATQTYTPSKSRKGKIQGDVTRKAPCPYEGHKNKIGKFSHSEYNEGEKRIVWVFRCTEKGGHRFEALPDRSAPKTSEEFFEWVKKQEMNKVLSLDVNKRTKK